MEPNKLLEERVGRVRTIHLALVLTSLIGLVMQPVVRSTLHEELSSIRTMLTSLPVSNPDPSRQADRFDRFYRDYISDTINNVSAFDSETTNKVSAFDGTCFDLGEPSGVRCFESILSVRDFLGASHQDINHDWYEMRHNLSKFFTFWDQHRGDYCESVFSPSKEDAYIFENGLSRKLKSVPRPATTSAAPLGIDHRTFGLDDLWECSPEPRHSDQPEILDKACKETAWPVVIVAEVGREKWFVAATGDRQDCPKDSPSVAQYLTHGQGKTAPWAPLLDSQSNAPLASALLVDLDKLKSRPPRISTSNTPMEDLGRLDEFEAFSKAQAEKEKSVKVLEIDIDVATAEHWLPALLIALQLVIAILLGGIAEAQLSWPDGQMWKWSSTIALMVSVIVLPAAAGYRIAGWLTAALLVPGGVAVLLQSKKLKAICL